VNFSSPVNVASAASKTFVKIVGGDILLEVVCSLDENERFLGARIGAGVVVATASVVLEVDAEKTG
jgi:hypothetical protein